MRVLYIGITAVILCTTGFSKTFTVGIVPQQSQLAIAKDWKPIIDYLETTTGDTFILKTERSIPEFEKVFYSGGYDIAYANPYHYVIAHKKRGYIAAVRDEKNLVGILVTKKAGPITSVAMLRGKRFLFPAPDAFAATLVIKYELFRQYGIDLERDKTFSYVNSHDSVYKGVARDIGDAGGGIERTLSDLDDKETRDSLVILHKTKAYPSHPIAFKPTVSQTDQAKITKALLNTPAELLVPLKIKRLIEIKDSQYDTVRDIADVLPTAD
jgi:phosphonate transport system substrate-binding protein